MNSPLHSRYAKLLLLVAFAAGCSGANAEQDTASLSMAEAKGLESAIFAGGCFWCMEPPFDKLDGVVATTSGYTGGTEKNPTYKEVASGKTTHTEAVEVLYDPNKIDYAKLLDVFWRNIDPLTRDAQFCDRGSQYRTGIFYRNEEQKALAEKSRRDIEESGILEGPIVTEITRAAEFYPAEDYHQNFYKKNPDHYNRYRTGCGRDRDLERIWGPEPS